MKSDQDIDEILRGPFILGHPICLQIQSYKNYRILFINYSILSKGKKNDEDQQLEVIINVAPNCSG
jgi:hypothetical protein